MVDDKVWFDEVTKLRQVCNDVAAARLDGRSVLLLSYFGATLSLLSNLLREKGIDHDQFSTFNPAELCASTPGKVWLGSALAFHVANPASAAVTGSVLEIIVAEHHPMQSRDQQLVDSAKKTVVRRQPMFPLLTRRSGNEALRRGNDQGTLRASGNSQRRMRFTPPGYGGHTHCSGED